MSDADGLDAERLARGLAAPFARRIVELAPACVLAYHAAEWRDAIVFVTGGEIEVETAGGACWRFRDGDILCLAPFPVLVVRSVGTEPARLLAIRRLPPSPPGEP